MCRFRVNRHGAPWAGGDGDYRCTRRLLAGIVAVKQLTLRDGVDRARADEQLWLAIAARTEAEHRGGHPRLQFLPPTVTQPPRRRPPAAGELDAPVVVSLI